MRRGIVDFIRSLKALPGVRQVTLTTNGLHLPSLLDGLLDAGLDAVNISLDTRDNAQYQAITRSSHTADEVLHAVRLCAGRLPTKVNAVLLSETAAQLVPLARLAEELPVDVRFIERMPHRRGQCQRQRTCTQGNHRPFTRGLAGSCVCSETVRQRPGAVLCLDEAEWLHQG